MTHRIVMIPFENCITTGVIGPMDLFGVANMISRRITGSEEPLFELLTYSESGMPVTSSSGYPIPVSGDISEVRKGDIVYFPAGMIATGRELKPFIDSWQGLIEWLRDNHHKLDLVATHCSGSFLLAEAGVLNGQVATTAWWLTASMKKYYPRIAVDADAGCTQAGKFLCGAASFSFQDVSLAIIEKYAGKHFARLVAKYMMIDNQRQSQAPYAILTLFESSDPVVNKAEQWIRANLSRDFRIDEVASEVAVSPRTLIRRFQKSLDESPQSFTQKLRIEKCKALLETTQMSFAEIVQRCGYSDESAFRRLFKRFCDLSPREYRKRFTKAA